MSEKKIAPLRVGILGGSFNPPHLGHVAMAEFVLKGGEVDQVWVVPCFEHPFDKPLLSFEDRFQMCGLAFRSLGKNVRVMDVEKKLGGKSYTLRTVQHLKKEYPNDFFWLVVGEDIAQEAKHWHQYEELKKGVEWLVLPRGEGSPIPNISASEIRMALPQRKNLQDLLSKEVIQYIEGHQLYAK